MEIKCNICGLEFENVKLKANHIRWKHKEKTYSKEGHKLASEKRKKANELKYGKWIEEETDCFKCEKKIKIKYREEKRKKKYFCSRSCANSRTHSQKTKNKISSSMEKVWENEEYKNKMIKHSMENLKVFFNSKGELEVKDFFVKNFPDDNWTSGGFLKIGGEYFQRDLYSNKLKICIEYDGIWHFKDIKGQLKNKQRKDDILDNWCLESGWRIIRIREKIYKQDKEKWLNILEEEVYNGKEKVIKFY